MQKTIFGKSLIYWAVTSTSLLYSLFLITTLSSSKTLPIPFSRKLHAAKQNVKNFGQHFNEDAAICQFISTYQFYLLVYGHNRCNLIFTSFFSSNFMSLISSFVVLLFRCFTRPCKVYLLCQAIPVIGKHTLTTLTQLYNNML